MKASPLVQQLTEARPRRKAKPPKDAPPVPAETPSAADTAKGEAFATYEEDWRFKALDEFNIEQKEEFHIDDDQSSYDDRMEFRSGDVTWEIYQTEEAAEAVALAQVRDDLVNEPETLSADFIQGHINQEKLKNELWNDVREHRSEDFGEMSQEEQIEELDRHGVLDEDTAYVEKKELAYLSQKEQDELVDKYILELASVSDDASEQYLADERERLKEMDSEELIPILLAVDWFNIDEDDFFTTEKVLVDNIDDVIEKAKDAYLDKLGEEFDPMDWLNDIYGQEEAQEEAVRIGGIDIDEAAKEAVNTDGWSHFLNRYDGNYSSLHCGAVYFRSN